MDKLEKEIFKEMNRKICSITVEEYQEIQREVELEIYFQERRVKFEKEKIYGF
jgi:hypothetical protein